MQFKTKCSFCKKEWVLSKRGEYPLCVDCHMRIIYGEEITDKKYEFLEIDKKYYRKSRFLRNIRQAYIRYHELTDKQKEAFLKTVQDVKKGRYDKD